MAATSTGCFLDTVDNIAHWHTHIFASLLNIVMVLGTLTAVPSAALAASEGLWSVTVMDAVALGWLTAIWWCKRVRYTVRVLNFLAMILMVGVGLMLAVGPVSQIYLVAAPVLAALLLGMAPALWVLAASALAIFGITLAGVDKLHPVYVGGLPGHELLQSLILTMNYLFIGATLTVSCAILLQRLARSLDDLRRFADSLQQGKNALHSLNAELHLTAAAVAHLNDMVVIARVAEGPGAEQPIIFVNDAFERIAVAMTRTESVATELQYYTKLGPALLG